ncbi:AhpC/TSA family protein [Pseudonocardiaceae bacterium YIM PH 21723]|nr:AhpC/TSA family protein [Pseudonocardiaceae bacterium YIM PH 21723]
MSSSIAARVEVMQQELAGQLPASALNVFVGEIARFQAEGLPAGVATPGTPMPDGALLDAHGAATTLTAARNGRPAVVVTYRGAWCPYCNVALRTYQEDLLPALRERGIELIALSPQKPDQSLSTVEKNGLGFTVLSDPGNQIAEALGVLTQHSERAHETQRELGLDLADVNADGGYGLPMPTVLLVGADGVIRWIDVHPDYSTRTEVADILPALDLL